MPTRRQFLQRSALAGVGACSFPLRGLAPAASTLVKTPLGQVRGESVGGVRVFRGVPFAQPPVGPLRFLPPQPVRAWSDVKDATRFADAAAQPGDNGLTGSEDCLYLNVWAPETGGPYPVFVWIHGGGFTGGRSFDPLYDGTQFARNGIVCITVAYRLGVFGFLDMEPLLGSRYAGSANNALRDLMASLAWVQGNVGTFGGDPHRVTIGGESAGAKLADTLMGVPSATSLFQQVISESGGAERLWPKANAAEVGSGFGSLWTKRNNLPVTDLLHAPASQLIGSQEQFTRDWPVHFPLRVEIDGSLIPRSPLDTIRSGSSRGKRLLLGTNRDESALFLGPEPAKDPTSRDLGNISLAQFQPLEARYAQLYPQMSDAQRRIRSVTAEEYWIPSMRVVEAHLAGGGGPAFVYRLDFPGTGRYAGEAFHSYDLRFVWDHFGNETPSEAASALGNEMHTAWAAFIAGRIPAATGLPAWPAFTAEARQTMILDAPSHVDPSPDAGELALWNGLLMH